MNKNNYIEKIIQSHTFENSHQLIVLFKYLWEATQKNFKIKELNIAEDVYDRKTHFNSTDDPIVRVNISHLRKKLAAYYASEGKTDKIKVQIPKGHYQIQLVRRPFYSMAYYKTRILWILLVIFILATGTLSFYVHSLYNQMNKLKENSNPVQQISSADPIWEEFLDKRKSVIIALGDFFFYRMQHEGLNRKIFVRDFKVNNQNDFDEMLNNFPEMASHIQKLEHTYFAKSTVWPIPEIISIIKPHNNNIQLRRTSELNPEDIKQNNIIFIGNIKTMGDLKHFLELSTIQINLLPRSISFTPETSDSAVSVTPLGKAHEYHTNFGFVVKVPGPEDNYILFICDFTGTANIGAAKYLSDPKLLEHLEKKYIEKYKEMPQYFELVFKVPGLKWTEFDTEVIHYREIRTKK